MAKFLKGLFGFLVFLVFLAVLGRILLFELVTTDSFSMIPTLVPGDLFLVYTRGEIGPGEVVVCKHPRNPGSMVVGRVLGVPGSTFAIVSDRPVLNDSVKEIMNSDTSVYVDNTSGEFLQYLIKTNYETVGGHEYRVAHMERAGEKNYPMEEIEDGYFLVGDNRNRAHDSRHYGLVPVDSCMGTAVFVVWPGEDCGDYKRKDRYLKWLL